MAEDEFTQIRIKKETQRKIGILSRTLDDVTIYGLVESWTDIEWERAKRLGLVTDAMLVPQAHFVQAAPVESLDA